MTLVNSNCRFTEMASPRQRSDLNAWLCRRFGLPSNAVIQFRTIGIEQKGGVRWFYLRAVHGGSTLDFHVEWLNRKGKMDVGEGWKMKHDSEDVLYFRGRAA